MPNSRARLHQQVEDGVLHLDRMMQLPSELADEIDAQRVRRRRADVISLPESQGKAAFERSASVTFCSTSRERGPASTSTPYACRDLLHADAAVASAGASQHVVVVPLSAPAETR